MCNCSNCTTIHRDTIPCDSMFYDMIPESVPGMSFNIIPPPKQTPVKLFVEDKSLLPQKGTEFSAAYDVFAKDDYTIKVGETTYVGTGVYAEVRPGFVIDLRSRSGLSSKQGVILVNGVGTIDSDYRGEIKAAMTLLSGYQDTVDTKSGIECYQIKKGDKIAQILIHQHFDMNLTIVDSIESLTKTVRGEGGFNSTGR